MLTQRHEEERLLAYLSAGFDQATSRKDLRDSGSIILRNHSGNAAATQPITERLALDADSLMVAEIWDANQSIIQPAELSANQPSDIRPERMHICLCKLVRSLSIW